MIRLFAFLSALFLSAPASAAVGHAEPWEINFQESASTIADKIHQFHFMLLIIITAITLLVLGLIVWVVIRYNHKANPVPATFTHNRFWERLWTIIPCLILAVVAVPSFGLMSYQGKVPEPDLTIKATGYQWYWGYEYPEQEISFQSYMIPEKDIDTTKGQVRLLSTDNAVVVPVGANVQLLTTAADVIHSWAMPAFGVKKDAVPGRLNETWFKATKPGIYYGQCSEICGTGHAYMPIEIHAVPQVEFDQWVEEAKTKFGAAATTTNVAFAE